MTEEREQLLEETIKEMLAAKMQSSEERNNLLEKLVRQLINGNPQKIMEFEPFMSEQMKKRFQFELDMQKFTGL
jgi:hypothetical protein